MKKRLKEELRKLSTEIITSRNLNDYSALYETARQLYEKLAVLKYIEEKSVSVFPLHEHWLDVGNPENLKKAQEIE